MTPTLILIWALSQSVCLSFVSLSAATLQNRKILTPTDSAIGGLWSNTCASLRARTIYERPDCRGRVDRFEAHACSYVITGLSHCNPRRDMHKHSSVASVHRSISCVRCCCRSSRSKLGSVNRLTFRNLSTSVTLSGGARTASLRSQGPSNRVRRCQRCRPSGSAQAATADSLITAE